MGIIFFLFLSVLCSSKEFNPLCNDEYASIVDCFWYEGIHTNMNTPSYILESSRFLDSCALSNMTRIIECYNNVIDSCPYYRDNGPFLTPKESFQSFLVGTCLHKEVYEDGMKCIGTREGIWSYNSNKDCITTELQNNIWDAYIQMGDWTWEKYCKLLEEGIECSASKVLDYGCSVEFYDYLRHSAFARMPEECYNNNTQYEWLNLYKELPVTLVKNETETTSSSITLTSYSLLLLICLAGFLSNINMETFVYI